MSFLAAGFLIGMRHALDSDHLTAVAVLVADKPSVSSAVRQGVIWGIGHSATLLLVGLAVIVSDVQLSEELTHVFELLVGLMLIALGIDCLRRWRRRDQIIHAASRTPPGDHRALGVGLMHGLAGSSALILLTMSTLDTTELAFGYMALFGVGSVFGMAMLSLGLAYLLNHLNRQHHNALTITRVAASLASIVLGGLLLLNSAASL